ncbi:hypothetical protein V144x_50530 [Gimesia aquarii]|uniref:Uncharacterized protein n=1 Tax=Gimesia aquarii TaxID=2527964 RepID=A0A517W2P2_9PLAN|nr:hypothetical protein V144x_50530 [Gimesia aquarii]
MIFIQIAAWRIESDDEIAQQEFESEWRPALREFFYTPYVRDVRCRRLMSQTNSRFEQ